MKKVLVFLALAVALVLCLVSCGHEHSFCEWSTTKAPSCSQDGEQERACSCGEVETRAIMATGHKWTEATCKAPKTCSDCGKTEGSALEHNWTEATCTTPKTCLNCNTTEGVPAGHKFGSWETTVVPTCVDEGEMVRVCSSCELEEKSTMKPITSNHKPVTDSAVPPTCTEPGLTEGSHCELCPVIIKAQEVIPAKGHTKETVPGYDSTCTKTGLTNGEKCSVCGDTLLEQKEIPLKEHVFDDDYDATCNIPGCPFERDPKCRHSKTEPIPGYPATCTVDGYEAGTKCSDCQAILLERKLIKAPGHTEEAIPAVPATCYSTGLTAGIKCKVCGDILKSQETTQKLNHTPAKAVEENRMEATCTEAGSYDLVVYCSVEKCKYKISSEHKTILATGHTPGADATCTTPQICTTCNETLVPAKGHTYSDKWLFDEEYHYHVPVCGCDVDSNKKDVTKHTFDSNEDCLVCGFRKQIKLDTPVISGIEYDTVSWTPVGRANKYIVTLNSKYGDYSTTVPAEINSIVLELLKNSSGDSLINNAQISVTVQAIGSSDKYINSDKSASVSYYYVPEKQNLSSVEEKLSTEYGLGYGYNLLDYEPINAEKISHNQIININKLLTLGTIYNPPITAGKNYLYRYSSIEELSYHLEGSLDTNLGLSIPMIGQAKRQMNLDLGFDHSEYNYSQTYTLNEAIVKRTYGIKNYDESLLKHCLTQMFVEDIKLAESMEEDAWLDYMLKKYGTHVILGVATGAEYIATYTIATNKVDVAAKVNLAFGRSAGLSFKEIIGVDIGLDLGWDVSLGGDGSWSREETVAHLNTFFKGATAGGATSPEDFDSAIARFESQVTEENALAVRFADNGAISLGSLISMIDASLGEKFENYVIEKGDEEFQALYKKYTKPSDFPVSLNKENGINVLRIDLSSYQNGGSLANAYNTNLLDGIFTVFPKMMGKTVDKIVITGAFNEYNEKLIDSFTIKLADKWNKDITIEVENLGVICASPEGLVDIPDGYFPYDVAINYTGVNAVQGTDGKIRFYSSTDNQKYNFEFTVATDEDLDFSTVSLSNILRLPMASKPGYVFVGWYDQNGNPVTDNKAYVLDSYVGGNNVIAIHAQFIGYSQGLEYRLNDDRQSFMVSGIGTCTDSDISILLTYEGLPVTAIDISAFAGNDSITSIIIPDSVTYIGAFAFRDCSSLKSVIFGENSKLEDIGGCAFWNCTSLMTFEIPASVTNIDCRAFDGCTSLEYNKYDNALYLGCKDNPYFALIKAKDSKITSCNIHNSTKIIGGEAFYNCTSLIRVVIPDRVTSIGDYAFDNCRKLEFNECDNALYLGNEDNPYYALIKASSFSISSCVIHEDATLIAGSAFSNCDSLTSIVIPDGVIFICGDVFYGCESLASVTIGNGVTSIGSSAFNYCTSLTSVTIGNNVTSIGDYAFMNCTSLKSVTIGNGVTSISSYAFFGCTSLTSVTIGNNVTSIGSHAFSDCTSLTSVTIGNNVTSIGSNAFYGCTSLMTVKIGNSVTSIGSNAFYGCTSLMNVTIGNGLTSIGSYAFYGCDNLTSVSFDDPDGWYVVGRDGTNGINLTLTNASTNANYLNITYSYLSWYKK